MKKLMLSIAAVVLTTVVVSGCVGSSGTPSTTSNPGNIKQMNPVPATGLPSQGSGAAPAMPPQIGSYPITVSPPQVASAPAASGPSQGSSQAAMFPVTMGGTYYNNQPQNTGIWVTGQGQVSASPDVASLTMGVQAQSLTVADAQSKASTSMDSIIQVLKAHGVADKDITTISYSISPLMNYKNNTILGYQVSNLVTAKIRKLSDTGSIIDAVTSAGGNFIQISGISFTVDDPTPFLKQARQLAMADAAARAAQLASSAGVKLGQPTYISESTSNYVPIPVWYAQGAAVASGTTAAAPSIVTPISPAQTQITVSVQVVYSIQ